MLCDSRVITAELGAIFPALRKNSVLHASPAYPLCSLASAPSSSPLFHLLLLAAPRHMLVRLPRKQDSALITALESLAYPFMTNGGVNGTARDLKEPELANDFIVKWPSRG